MFLPTYFRQQCQTLFKLNKLEKMPSIATKPIALIYHYAKDNADRITDRMNCISLFFDTSDFA